MIRRPGEGEWRGGTAWREGVERRAAARCPTESLITGEVDRRTKLVLALARLVKLADPLTSLVPDAHLL